VKKVYQSLKIREITLEEIEKYFSKALQSCDGIHADEKSKKVLALFANELLKRDF
jgi:geranylgeranyl pyrophosphate synthase